MRRGYLYFLISTVCQHSLTSFVFYMLRPEWTIRQIGKIYCRLKTAYIRQLQRHITVPPPKTEMGMMFSLLLSLIRSRL
jgi:hypothetical protein